VGIVVAEFEFRHGGMTGRDAALEQPGKLIEIEAAAERAKRRRFVQTAAVGFPIAWQFAQNSLSSARPCRAGSCACAAEPRINNASNDAISGMIVVGSRCILKLAICTGEAMARRKGFKPLTPRFEVSMPENYPAPPSFLVMPFCLKIGHFWSILNSRSSYDFRFGGSLVVPF
jgi:hypothetical protein